MSSGMNVPDVYLGVLAPALRSIGQSWEEGSITIAEEHRASAVAERIVSRLGARLARRGRRRGVVVVGGPCGEQHRLPVMMVADLLRGAGFEVVDLGVDLPTQSLVAAVVAASPLLVGISVTSAGTLDAAASLVHQLRSTLDVPIILGGRAVRDEAQARALGGHGYGADVRAAVVFAESLR
jgi:methanogenic corrinoid protein MtbC1